MLTPQSMATVAGVAALLLAGETAARPYDLDHRIIERVGENGLIAEFEIPSQIQGDKIRIAVVRVGVACEENQQPLVLGRMLGGSFEARRDSLRLAVRDLASADTLHTYGNPCDALYLKVAETLKTILASGETKVTVLMRAERGRLLVGEDQPLRMRISYGYPGAARLGRN